MDEAQNLADDVAIIARGEIVAHGSPSALGGRDTAATLVTFRIPEGADLPASIGAETDGATARIRTSDATRTLHELTGWAVSRGVRLDTLEVSRPSLEDVYLELTGGEAGIEG